MVRENMNETHFITIPKEQFEKIEIGDRLIIQNDEDNFCYVVYVEENEQDNMKVRFDGGIIASNTRLVR